MKTKILITLAALIGLGVGGVLVLILIGPRGFIAPPEEGEDLRPSIEEEFEGGPPQVEIFTDRDFIPYDSWKEINAILAKYKVEAVPIGEEGKEIDLTPQEKEKFRLSLTYFTFALDSMFRGTRIGEFLERFEVCYTCRSLRWAVNWGNVIRMTPAREEEKELYTLTAIHEIGHSFDLLENIDEFLRICWNPNEEGMWMHDNPVMDSSCSEAEKAFIPDSLTTSKMLVQAPGEPGDYYSASHFREDLAESVAAYRISPEEFRALAQKYPKLAAKYEFIKRYVFEGKEF